MALTLAVLGLSACSDQGIEYSTFTDTREESLDQSFEVKHVRTDVLFYADTSYSMERELVVMADAIEQFVKRIDRNADDWQLAAVTGPDGCANKGILTPETPDWAGKFAAGIRQAPPDAEALGVDEWGLFNVFKAVIASAPGQCNEGFVRQDSLLHIIFLTDEDDNSPGWELGGDYWRDYVDPILYFKADEAQVRFSAIAGPVDDSCLPGADPGYGYSDAVDATGGEFLAICEDWQKKVDLLADASIVQAFFPLDWPAIEASVEVEVNGTPRKEGWHYDTDRQGVLFTADLPVAWDKVDVSYTGIVEFEVQEPAE